MGVYGGNIGPRRPSQFGESCLNCGMAFILQPGVKDIDGKKMLEWKCSGCNRVEHHPAPYNMQSGGKVETSKDFVE